MGSFPATNCYIANPKQCNLNPQEADIVIACLPVAAAAGTAGPEATHSPLQEVRSIEFFLSLRQLLGKLLCIPAYKCMAPPAAANTGCSGLAAVPAAAATTTGQNVCCYGSTPLFLHRVRRH